jgi:hypothetical protein
MRSIIFPPDHLHGESKPATAAVDTVAATSSSISHGVRDQEEFLAVGGDGDIHVGDLTPRDVAVEDN